MIIILKAIERKNLYGEYVIREYHNGIEIKERTYFTDDLDDLHATYHCVINQLIDFEKCKVIDSYFQTKSYSTILVKGGE